MALSGSALTGSDDRTADFDAIVIGAGISGLVSASILLEQGSQRVLVVDEYPRVGGNHIDCSYNGYTFDVGSFIFQDDSPLLRHFPEMLPLYVSINPIWGKLSPQGLITDYPFSIRDDLMRAGARECALILMSAGVSRIRYRRMLNARDFARYWIGSRLADRSGLESYMERFCGLPAERIDLKFAEKRMLWIAEYASVHNLLRRVLKARSTSIATQPTNQQLARPPEGFEHLYRPTMRRLEDRGATFLLGEQLRTLKRVADRYQLCVGDEPYTADRVISTIPIDRMLAVCGTPADKALPGVTLLSLFFSFSGKRGFTQSVLYNFAHDGAWKRLTVYSDFYGQSGGREYFAVEVIAGDTPRPVESAVDDFREHTRKNGLFEGDLRLEGSHTLTSAYPIYTEGAGDRAERAIADLRAFGIESFGRQGGFQYQPTARVSTIEAETALKSGPG